MNLQGNIAFGVDQRIEEVRQKSGNRVSLDDVRTIIDGMIEAVLTEANADNYRMVAELREVLNYVVRARQEFLSIGPRALSSKKIPDASDELNAVLGATEEAAGQIMDAADQVGELAGNLDGDAARKLQDISTSLYEASSFQDICGQRITKVVAILKFLEERLTILAETLGDTDPGEEDGNVEFDENGLAVDADQLVQGPQLEGEGNSQDDVDALLADFDRAGDPKR